MPLEFMNLELNLLRSQNQITTCDNCRQNSVSHTKVCILCKSDSKQCSTQWYPGHIKPPRYYFLNYQFLHQCLSIPELKDSPPNISQTQHFSLPQRDFNPLWILPRATKGKTALLHLCASQTWQLHVLLLLWLSPLKITSRRKQDWMDLKCKFTVP